MCLQGFRPRKFAPLCPKGRSSSSDWPAPARRRRGCWRRAGRRVRAVDSGHPEGAAGLEGVGVEVFLDTDGVAQLEGTRTVVKSPGVPREAPVIAAALERGIEVVGELELAWRALPNRFVAVTGTNGKTTTVELLGHLYRTAGEPVAVAGNVGTPLSELVGEVDPEATVVCECSSFQLEDTTAFAPECAVFLNLAPDHLDRHGDLESYLAAKLRIFANQGNDDVAVYNADDPFAAGTDLGGCARRIAFCHGAAPDCEVARRRGDDLLRRRAAAGGRRARPLRRAQRRQRDGRRRGGAGDGDRPRGGPRGPAQLRRRPAPARAGRRDRRRPLRQRLEGDQRRLRRGRDPRLRAAASTRSSAAARRASRSRRCVDPLRRALPPPAT